MTTTDDNHTPALLSAARLAEIRDDADTCREAIEEGELDFKPCDQAVYDAAYRLIAEGTRALLAHIDALTPRAPVDGEALGRGLFEHMSALAWPNGRGEIGGPGWDGLREDSRSYYRAAALALHAIGHAAGAVAMTGEGDDPGTEGAVLILMKRHDGELHEAHAAGRSEGEAERARLQALLAAEHESAGVVIEGQQIEIARLTEECDAERVAVLDRDATIARLTTELAEARAALAIAANGSIDDIEAARRFGYHERDAEVAAARLDGAREEREECARIAEEEERLLYRQDGEQACSRIKRRIRARGAGGAG